MFEDFFRKHLPDLAGSAARCPFHDDRQKSLSVDVGRGLLKCHAGGCCWGGNVFQFAEKLGVAPPPNGNGSTHTSPPLKRPAAPIYATLQEAVQQTSAFLEAESATCWVEPYRHYDGSSMFAVARFEVALRDERGRKVRNGDGTGFQTRKQVRPFYKLPDGRWQSRRPEDFGSHPIFRLGPLEAADEVFVFEGEMKSQLVHEVTGRLVVTTMGGAGKANLTDLGPLAGKRRVVLFADHNKAGHDHMADIARRLRTLAPPPSAHVASLPLTDGEDVADFIKNRRREGASDLTIKDEILAAAAAAKPLDVCEASVSNAVAEGEEWGEPVPLDSTANLPPVPLEAFPPCVGDFAAATAELLQCPADAPALLGLGVMGAAIAKKYELEIHEGWHETPNLYILPVLPSGEMKSACFTRCLRPVHEFEHEQAAAMAGEIEAAKAERKMLEMTIKAAEKSLLKLPDCKESQRRMAEALAALDKHAVPAPPRLTCGDSTPEKLGVLLQENGERMLLAGAEGGIIESVVGRYGDGPPNLDLILGGFAGDSVVVDRVSRPPVKLRAPLLSLAITIQPEILNGFARRPEFRGRGVLARFVFSTPTTRVGFRQWKPRHRDRRAEEVYCETVKAMLRLRLPVAADGRRAEPTTLKLDPEAQEALLAYAQDVEERMRPGGDLANLPEWANRARGLAGRIALIFHIGEALCGGPFISETVRVETVKRAVALARFAEAHARAAHNRMGLDPATEAAKALLRFLADRRLTRISRRDAFRALQGRLQRVEEVNGPLDVLVDLGYLREGEVTRRSGPGRRPSAVFEVHPRVVDLVAGCPTPTLTHETPAAAEPEPHEAGPIGERA